MCVSVCPDKHLLVNIEGDVDVARAMEQTSTVTGLKFYLFIYQHILWIDCVSLTSLLWWGMGGTPHKILGESDEPILGEWWVSSNFDPHNSPKIGPGAPKITCAILSPKGGTGAVGVLFFDFCCQLARGAPKLDPNLLPVSVDFARSSSAPSLDCHCSDCSRLDCPRVTPTTPSVLVSLAHFIVSNNAVAWTSETS